MKNIENFSEFYREAAEHGVAEHLGSIQAVKALWNYFMDFGLKGGEVELDWEAIKENFIAMWIVDYCKEYHAPAFERAFVDVVARCVDTKMEWFVEDQKAENPEWEAYSDYKKQKLYEEAEATCWEYYYYKDQETREDVEEAAARAVMADVAVICRDVEWLAVELVYYDIYNDLVLLKR